MRRIAYALPARWCDRGLPSQWPDWRRGVRDAAICPRRPGANAPDRSTIGGDHAGLGARHERTRLGFCGTSIDGLEMRIAAKTTGGDDCDQPRRRWNKLS